MKKAKTVVTKKGQTSYDEFIDDDLEKATKNNQSVG